MVTKVRIDSSWPFGFPYPDPPAFLLIFSFLFPICVTTSITSEQNGLAPWLLVDP